MPLTEGWGALPDIKGDIPDFAVGALDELALGEGPLIMEATEDIFSGETEVILNEDVGEIEVGKFFFVICFEEIAAFIAEDLGFENDDAGDCSFD